MGRRVLYKVRPISGEFAALPHCNITIVDYYYFQFWMQAKQMMYWMIS
jgi:hypothetical protein